jgi:1,4-dihydroxy-2-naphthoate octaprenyltransferase
VGSAVAQHAGAFVWWRALLALAVALAMQIGVNYANDYSDGIRGTDERRVGPVRLVAAKLATPQEVKRAAFLAFGVGMLAGLVLAVVSSWWLLAAGAASVLAAWFYTGGEKPYGYRGLGEVSVFVFFGLVAVVGTALAQTEHLEALAFAAAVPVGLLAVALLVVNNLRDRPNDQQVGKRTLAVRLGDARTRDLYRICVLAPFVLVLCLAVRAPWELVALLALPLGAGAVRPVVRGAVGPELIRVLQRTGKLQMAFGGLLALGLVL